MGGHIWASLPARAANLMSGGIEPGLVSRAAQEANTPANATSDLISELQWSAAKSIRTSIITLASFNVLAATVTLACVLWDCYSGARRKDPQVTIRDFRPSFVGSPQVYPLVLSLGIIVQGIIFAVAQARGLEALLIEGCVPVSHMMMPATFLVPFIQLILGFETTVRAFSRHPFPARRRWVIPVCLGVIIAGLIALYAVTLSLRPPDFCFASLFWFTQQWGPVCFGLLLGIAVALLFCLLVVFFRLRHGTVSTIIERMAASHMLYYIAIAVISNALLTPFFFSITFGNQDASASSAMELSTVSSIVANLSGLTTGGLYLFLRGQIRPRLSSYKHETYDFDAKYFDKAGEKRGSYYAAGLDPSGRLSSPSIYSQNENGNISFSRNSDEKKLRGPIPGPESGNGTSLGMGGRPDLTEVLATTAPTGDSSKRESEAHSRSSYGFFTQYSPKAENTSPGLLPSTTYTPSSSRPPLESKRDNMLMPPPLFHAPKTGWHTRNSSVGSSQTVQIGLRISNMNEVQTMRSSQLHSPRQAQGLRSFAPVPASHDSSQAMGRAGHVKQPSSGSVELNKQLPKVPPESPAQHDEAQKRFTQLSPTVYEPQKQPPRARLASPKGVGFQTAPADRALRRGPQLSPSINAATEKGGWI